MDYTLKNKTYLLLKYNNLYLFSTYIMLKIILKKSLLPYNENHFQKFLYYLLLSIAIKKMSYVRKN